MSSSEPSPPSEFSDLVAIDLETTGLYAVSERIIEIGAVRFRANGEVVDTFHSLVNPHTAIPFESERIHHISNAMVADAPSIKDVLPAFIEFLGERTSLLVAHNAAFDVEFLAIAFARAGMKLPAHDVVDSYPLARMRLGLENHRLETIGRHLKLIDAELHRALDDAVLLKDVMLQLLAVPPAIESWSELLRHSPGPRFDDVIASARDLPSRLAVLGRALRAGRDISMRYTGGSQPGQTRVVSPRILLQLRGRLYLSAVCHRAECEKSFRIDRIRDCRLV